MAYWITLKKGVLRNAFQAVTAQEALDVLLSSQHERYDEVRVIHPDGYLMTALALAEEAESEDQTRRAALADA